MKFKQVYSLIAVALLTGLPACKKSEPTAGSETDSPSSRAESGNATASETKSVEGSPSPAGDGEAVVLKAKWPVGNRYVYRMDIEQHNVSKIPQMPTPMKQDVTMAMTYALSIVKELPNNTREVEAEFLANEMDVQMGGQTMISFDSKESDKDEQNPIVGPYKKMIGSKIRMEVNADGSVNKVLGFQEWQDEVTADVPEMGKGMFSQQFNEGTFRQMADFARALPSKAVQLGESWPFNIDMPLGPMGKLGINTTVTFKGWETRDQRNCALMTSTGTMKSTGAGEAGPMGKLTIEKGKVVGKSWFDPELGALIEADSDQQMTLKSEVPAGQRGGGPPGGGFTSDINQKVILKLVELGKTKS